MQTNAQTMRSAIADGQYRFPAALFFGGFEPSWARYQLETIINEHVGAAETDCLIDLHTGLGEAGVGKFIGSHTAGTSERALNAQSGITIMSWAASRASSPMSSRGICLRGSGCDCPTLP